MAKKSHFPLKVLQIHNHYIEKTGGEFYVAEMDKNILESLGHSVIRYIRDNIEILQYNYIQKIKLFIETLWSLKTKKDIRKILFQEKPDIVHVHNFFPLISPSIFWEIKRHNIPVVWTLHNYRLICAEAQFLREGKACDKCLSKSKFHAIKNKCYRNSAFASMTVVVMNLLHKIIGTWNNKVDTFLVLTNFGKNIFIKYGIAPNKIVIKPNVIYPDPGPRNEADVKDYALFLGHHSVKKGVELLIDVWKDVDYELIMAGGGPLLNKLQKQAEREHAKVTFKGPISHQESLRLLKGAYFLVLPSLHYEGFPLVLSEALALGVPVITSDSGPMPELVINEITGLLVNPGDKVDLKTKIFWAISNPMRMREMGLNVRKFFDEKYSVRNNISILLNVYNKVLHRQSN
jgi:glycosyltransferase involved in cell wall biosynthesis